MVKDIDKFKEELKERNSKKKKKKGFTLVELLAVFVVLAIIAGIAIFYMNNVKTTFTKSVYEQSVKNILTAAQNYYAANADSSFPSNGLSVTDNDLQAENKSSLTGGMIYYNSVTGKLEAKNITSDDYCANGPIDDLIITEGACPSTDLACFTYEDNANNGVTITGFDYSNSACKGFVVVPETIDGKTVNEIGFAAFADVETVDTTDCYATNSSIERSSNIQKGNIKATPLAASGFSSLENNSCFLYTTGYNYSNACSNFYSYNDSSLKFGTLLKNNPVAATLVSASGGSLPCSANYTVTGVTINEKGRALTGIMLPSTITSIDDLAFARTGLTAINFKNLTVLNYIGDSAFAYTDLGTVDLSGLSKLKTIGFEAFLLSNIGVLKINNDNSLSVIRTSAFTMNNIESLDFSGTNNIIHIGAYSFAYNQINSLAINNLVRLSSLWPGAFCDNYFNSDPNVTNLTKVTSSDLSRACLTGNED